MVLQMDVLVVSEQFVSSSSLQVSGSGPTLRTLSSSSSGSAGAPAPAGGGIQAQTVRGDVTYTQQSGFKYCFREVKDGQVRGSRRTHFWYQHLFSVKKARAKSCQRPLEASLLITDTIWRRVWTVVSPEGGTTGNVRKSRKSFRFILWGLISSHDFIFQDVIKQFWAEVYVSPKLYLHQTRPRDLLVLDC